MSYKELYLNPRPNVFGGVSWRRDKTPLSLIGVPFDSTSSYKPGSRFAPDYIRIASRNIELYSIRSQVDVEEYGVYDEGDIAVVYGDVEKTLERVERVLSDIFSESRFPVVIGGEHTISYGVIKAISKRSVGVVVFDAHLDLRDGYMGLRFSHASVMKRVSEILEPGSLFYVGVRAVSREELGEVSRLGHEYILITSLRRLGLREVIKRFIRWSERYKTLYISIDVDALDPSVAPGVETPEPDGLMTWELLDLLDEIIDPRVVGVDIVEINPLNDPSEITVMLGSRIIVEIAAKIISLKRRSGG
ncbi:MAG: agmatinase [Sulfolobales archaeon]